MDDYLGYMHKQQLVSQEGKIAHVVLKSGREYFGIPTYFNGYFELALPLEAVYINGDVALAPAIKCSPKTSINFAPSSIMALPAPNSIYQASYSDEVVRIHGKHVWSAYSCQKS